MSRSARIKRVGFIAGVIVLVSTGRALAGNPDDAASGVMAALALILATSAVVHDLCARAGQPVVMGEMLAGILLRNLPVVGPAVTDRLIRDVPLATLAQLGIAMMLFEIGIESTVGEVVGILWSATKVATFGFAASFSLGWIVTSWLIPGATGLAKFFIAGAMTTTSAGVPARIIRDSGCSRLPETRLILSAAVIDDILGLVLLAVATHAARSVTTGSVGDLPEILLIVAKALAFLLVTTAVGLRTVPRLFALASRLKGENVLLGTGLSLCFFMAYLAHRAGLAPLIGAYVAGLVIEPEHNDPFVARGERPLQELTSPLSSLLTPVFFLLVGMRVDLATLADARTVTLAIALTAAAWLGKQACMLGVEEDRLAVGLGMVPRGEVSLIFVALGAGLSTGGQPVISQAAYSAIVLVVIATCLTASPALKWRLRILGKSSSMARNSSGSNVVTPGR